MAENEDIGGVSIGITGDYSDLADKFVSLQDIAETAGEKVAASFTDAAAGTKVLEEAFQGLITAGYTEAEAWGVFDEAVQASLSHLEEAGTQMDLFGGALEAIPFADANGQLNLFTDELEPFTTNVDAAAAGLDTFAGAADDASTSAETLYEGFNEFSDAAQSVIDREEDLNTKTATAAATLSELYQGFQDGKVSAGALALAQEDLAKAQDSVHESGDKAGLSVSSLVEAGLKLAGLEIGINMLKELAVNALETAADQELLVVSLNHLTGSAQATAERLQMIDEFSFKNALDIDTVEKVTQRMAAFGLSAEDSAKALQAANDAARATGGSFETAATKLENMAKAGMVGNRQLLELGLSTKDLGDVMGVAGEKVQKAFKDMDESERLGVLTTALEKFKGIGEESAETLSGKWQNMKNEFHNLLESSGTELAGFAGKLVDFAGGGIKAFSDALGTVETTFHNLKDAVGPVVGAIGTLGTAVGTMTGLLGPLKTAWDKAWETAKDYNTYALIIKGIDGVSGILNKLTGNAAIKDMNADLAEMSKMWVATRSSTADSVDAMERSITAAKNATGVATDSMSLYRQSVKDAQEKVDDLTKAYGAGKATASDLIGAQQALTNAQKTLNDAIAAGAKNTTTNFAALKAFIPPVEELASAEDLAAAMTDAHRIKTEALLLKMGALQDQVKQAVKNYDAALASGKNVYENEMKLVDATDQLDKSMKELGVDAKTWKDLMDHPPDIKESFGLMKTTIDLSNAGLSKALGQIRDMAPELAKVAPPVNDIAYEFKQMGLKIEDVDHKVSDGLVTNFENLQHVGGLTLDRLDAAWAKVSSSVATLADTDMPRAIRVYDEYIALLQKEGASQKTIQDAITAKLTAEISYAERSGADATRQIIDLANIKDAQQSAIDKTHMWGDLYVSALGDVHKAFGDIGNAIADNIVDAKDWGDVFQGVLKGIEKEILEQLIGSVFKQLGDVVTGAITNITGIGSVAKTAATTGADAAKTATDAIGSAGKVASDTMSGAAKAASSAVTSTALATVQAVASIVAAVGSIIGAIASIRLEGTMNAVEHNTRYLQIEFEQATDNIFWPLKVNSDYALGTLGDISTHTAGELATLQQWLPLLGDVVAWLGTIDVDVKDIHLVAGNGTDGAGAPGTTSTSSGGNQPTTTTTAPSPINDLVISNEEAQRQAYNAMLDRTPIGQPRGSMSFDDLLNASRLAPQSAPVAAAAASDLQAGARSVTVDLRGSTFSGGASESQVMGAVTRALRTAGANF